MQMQEDTALSFRMLPMQEPGVSGSTLKTCKSSAFKSRGFRRKLLEIQE
jgi:hypothetical protein